MRRSKLSIEKYKMLRILKMRIKGASKNGMELNPVFKEITD